MPDGTEISGFGLNAKNAPRWVIGLVAVTACLVLLYREVGRPEDRLVTERQANATLHAKMVEATKHLGETPLATLPLLDSVRGRIVVQLYQDLCLVASAYGADGRFISSMLTTDLTRGTEGAVALFSLPAVEAAQASSPCDRVGHGAIVKHAEEARDGCHVFVYVLLQDGCEYKQWVDGCSGAFGPRQWVKCQH